MAAEVSVTIMAHPKRRHFVDALAEHLPGAEIAWDKENDRWETGRRALLAHDRQAEYHIVVQDDAVLCNDFISGAAEALGHVRGRPVSFYTGAVRPHRQHVAPAVAKARSMGVPWIAMRGPIWGVAIAVPVNHIEPLVEYCDRLRDTPNYDKRIEGYYLHRGVECWYSQPSLVDHRPVGENPSLIWGRDGNRQAYWFIGQERSALNVRWTPEVQRVRALKIVSLRQLTGMQMP